MLFTVNEHKNICIAGLNRRVGYAILVLAKKLSISVVCCTFSSCLNMAELGGYRFFAVTDFRECWAGELTSEYFVSHAKANECWGARPNYKECNDDAETKCVGRPYYNYIYEIISGI